MILFQYNLLVLHFIILNHCFIAWEKKSAVSLMFTMSISYCSLSDPCTESVPTSYKNSCYWDQDMKSVPSGWSAHVTLWEASWEQGTLHYSRWFPFPGQVAQGEKKKRACVHLFSLLWYKMLVVIFK